MQRLAIQWVNGGVLVTILIGIPAITSAHFGSLELSSAPKAHLLTLWGMGLAAAGNAIAAVAFLKARRERLLAWKWASAFGALLGVEYLFVHHYFNFEWLKHALLWLRSHV